MAIKFYKKLFYSTSILALSALSPALSFAESPVSTISNTMYNPSLAGFIGTASTGTVISSGGIPSLPVTLSASSLPYNINTGDNLNININVSNAHNYNSLGKTYNTGTISSTATTGTAIYLSTSSAPTTIAATTTTSNTTNGIINPVTTQQTLGQTYSTGTITIAGGGTTSAITGNINSTGAITIAGGGTTSAITGNINSTDTITIAGGGTITGHVINAASRTLNVGSGITFVTAGSTVTNNAVIIDVSQTVNALTQNVVNIANSGIYTISAATISAANTNFTMVDNSYIYEYSVQPNAGGDIVITSAQANSFASAASAGNKSVGAALDNIAASDKNGNLGLLLAQFGTLRNQGEVNEALESLKPSEGAAATAALITTQNQSLSTISMRLADIRRANSGNTGIATGGEALNKAVWGQVFGSTAKQGYRSGVAGYDSDIWGMALGIDKDMFKDTNVGVSFSYAKTNVDSLKGQTDVDSYQGTVYGSYDQSKWYTEAMAGVGVNNYNNKRNVTIGSLANIASADYNGTQYTAKVGGGYKLPSVNDFNITPMASLQYTLLHQDNYTETGSTSNLAVNSNDTNTLQSGLGAKVTRVFNLGNYTISPEVRAMWLYDFVANTQATSSSLADAPSVAFTSPGVKLARNALDLGFGAQLLAGDQVTLSVDYDYQAKEDYSSHAASLKLKYKF